MAGATIPLTPAVHQMADVGPIDVLVESGAEVAFPIIRDMDTFCYERQTAGSMEVGSYAHRPIFHHPDDIPSNEESALSPTELPFTADDFDDQMEQAIDLMEMLGDAEIKYAINGLLSLTPDAMPVLGETVEVRNLWSAAAVWIKEGPGIAQLVAEWMTYGYPHVCDPHSSDISRFYPHERTEQHILARCTEHYNKTYGIVHPREQWASRRGMRRSPFYAREEALGAVFFDARGWERPQWYESNAAAAGALPGGRRRRGPTSGTPGGGRRSPTPSTWRCATRVGVVDLTAFNEFDLTGPGVVDYLQHLCVNNVDVAVGRSIYTPLLTPAGGFRADLTIMRLGRPALPGRHRRLRRRPGPVLVPPSPAPLDGSVTFTDVTSAWCTLGVWGPLAEATLDGLVTDRHGRADRPLDLSQQRLPVRLGARGADRRHPGRDVPHLVRRRERLGDLHADGARVWRCGTPIFAAGQPHGIVPVGIGVYAVTGRIEKGYRLMGAELESEYDPVEAGLARPKVKSADFIGKEAYLAARERQPAATLCTLEMLSHAGRRRDRSLPDRRQRADRDDRRRADRRCQGPGLAGDDRRRGAVARHVPADGLSAARARRRGHGAAGQVHGRAVPACASPASGAGRCSTRTTPA